MRNFENWITQDVEDTFHVERKWESELIDEWLKNDKSLNLTESQKAIIEDLRILLYKYADSLNEDELKMQFIAPLLNLIAYHDSEFYKPFSQRNIYAKIDDIEVGGRVDYVLARGKQLPQKPFFFIHEWNATRYKQEAKRDSDPKGQLLIELLAASVLNDNKNPVYGCYVIGRLWFFAATINRNYAVSRAYDASRQEDIIDIVNALFKIKTYIGKLGK
jgi:hypothetical protein